MPSVLFVCTANRIRSPLAAAIFRKELETRGFPLQDWVISSAGTWAEGGLDALPLAQHSAQELGISLVGHRSKIVTEKILSDHALVLTMEHGQKEALQVEFPQFAGKIYLLSEMIGQIYEIDDPVGGSLSGYHQAGRSILKIIREGMDKIITLATDNS